MKTKSYDAFSFNYQGCICMHLQCYGICGIVFADEAISKDKNSVLYFVYDNFILIEIQSIRLREQMTKMMLINKTS